MKKHIFLSLNFYCFVFFNLSAQFYHGLNFDHYSGYANWRYNPANLARTPYKFHINLFSLHTDFHNNYLALDRKAYMEAFFDDPDFYDKYVTKATGLKNYGLSFNTEVQFLGLTFSTGEKSGFGFSIRQRLLLNGLGFSQKFADFLGFGPDSFNNQLITSANTMASMNFFNELSFSYGRILISKNKHTLTAGITPKILLGNASFFVGFENPQFTYKMDQLISGDTTNALDIINTNTMFGFSSMIDVNFSGNRTFFRFNPTFGLAGDIGINYEYSPKYKDYLYEMDGKSDLVKRWLQPYLFKTGVSFTDIGGLNYKRSISASNFVAQYTNLPLDPTFSHIDSVNEVVFILDSLFDPLPTRKRYFMNLPTMFHWYFDFQPVQRVFITTSASISLNPGLSDFSKNRNFNSYGLNIRYEHPLFGIGTPIFYNTFSGLNWGTYLRLGPLSIGAPNLLSAMVRKNIRSATLFASLNIPVPSGKPKDRDKDKVSDKKDKCKTSPGVWEFNGCPDTDGDHVQDSEDDCPTEAGLKQFRGCPDKDNDGITDNQDDCPNEAGLAEFKGCPDRDGDKIMDKNDDCPDEKGLAQFRGCPDTDGDGLMDKQDRCPKLPGPISQQGCPDKDGDRIFDDEDVCVDVPGLVEFKGCPPPDRDKDGVLDKEDLCPDTPGPVANNGCPLNDLDGDGIPDRDDRCPSIKGVPENFGCPAIKEEVKETLKKVFENLEFETGKSIIRPSSYDELNELADLMKKESKLLLLIEGHTDNVGSRKSNITLSRNRANAVKNYLVKKGISPVRLKTAWYGPDRPVADNDTPEGRQRNRRVEFIVISN